MKMFRVVSYFGHSWVTLRWYLQRRRGLSWETIAIDDDQDFVLAVAVHLNRLAGSLVG